jgi:hypothetical protein
MLMRGWRQGCHPFAVDLGNGAWLIGPGRIPIQAFYERFFTTSEEEFVRKLILAGLVVALGLGGWWWLGQKSASPPVITMPNGTTVRLFAVTYGTNHVIGSKVGGLVANLPSLLQMLVKPVLGRSAVPLQMVTTATPELLVWLDHRTNRSGAMIPTGYMTALLGDGSNFDSGPEAFMNGFVPWSQVESLHFAAFPRRDREITLNIFDHDASGNAHACGSLTFANPCLKVYPEWQAEAVPVTKRAGDLEVTLQNVKIGTNQYTGRNETGLKLKFHPLTGTNEVWEPISAEISDATGNRAGNSSTVWTGGDQREFRFSPELWPREAAWKIKVEFKRTEGFRPEELLVFKNVPLGQVDVTNAIGWKTNIAGVTVTLKSFCRRAPQTNNTWNTLQLSDVHLTYTSAGTNNTRVDLLRMVCDTGKTNDSSGSSYSADEYHYYFREVPSEAETADFAFAVQKSRKVEFTVKPEIEEGKKKKKGDDGKMPR